MSKGRPDTPKWKKFERLVAAIHKAETKGADVSWNEKINGRQFDVVMRFKVGSYLYVTGIECRDKAKRIRVEEVEALVTKAKDAKLDKAIMVSSSDFQSGAKQVAEKHNIGLFTLQTIQGVPPEKLGGELVPMLRIDQIAIRRAEVEQWVLLPEDRNLPEYLARNLTISTLSDGAKSLHERREFMGSGLRIAH